MDWAVEPPGKYHWADVVLWHGASDQPVDPCTACDTATPPPAVVTVAASQVPEGRFGSDGAITPRAGTETAECTVAPESEAEVMSAGTARDVVLERTRKPGARPEPVVRPVQYHADDSASGGLTNAAGTASALGGVGEPLVPATTPTTTITAATTTSTGQRRSGV